MSKPYAIISDLHLHNWQAFSSNDGINSRLSGLLSEIRRCAFELKGVGGKRIYCAGDVFHVRGSIAPSVLNPTLDLFKELIEMGFEIRMIPGNHDLEGKHSNRIGSAVTALEGIGVDVAHETKVFIDDMVMMVPWYDKLDDLRAELQELSDRNLDRAKWSVMIHAPLNGVIEGLPEHGLSSTELDDYGFARIFAGHHHNHKKMEYGAVWSIGALAHNSWSDVGSKAGFLIVDGDNVKWFKSHLPEFVDLSADMDKTDAELAADGNYVRAKTHESNTAAIQELRSWLVENGAKGVVIQHIKTASASREATVTAAIGEGKSLEATVSEYVKAKFPALVEQIDLECQKVLAEAGV